MGNLLVKCKNCGKIFPSGIAMDKASFETSVIKDNRLQCPHCKNEGVYSKSDMIYQD